MTTLAGGAEKRVAAPVVSLTDIAALFGVTRAGADKITKRPGFPAHWTIGQARAWDRGEVERWAAANRP